MNNFQGKVSFIWSIAELLRGDYKQSEYADVILPLTVLRRLDCVLEKTRDRVLERYEEFKNKLDNPVHLLIHTAGYNFYNISPYNFTKLLADSANTAKNLIAYINGFSENMREIIDKFEFRNQIHRLEEVNLLFLVLERFNTIDLHPDMVSNLEMGYIFEELIRKFSEQSNETAGEHFTPREVIRLMVNILFSQDKAILEQKGIIKTVYDPACGTGGMLTVAKEHILNTINPSAGIQLFGQELNPKTFAVCKSDILIKSKDGREADNIKLGNCFSEDQHKGMRFDYMLSNPPFGVEWKKVADFVKEEAKRGYAGRFSAGLPRINDGSLLFLQHMISKMKDPREKGGEGSRIAIVFNGSPLFTGDAGSGESEIRRWIIENDWLEAIIALPDQLFYNTGIHTYIWIVTNRKEKPRRGKVQLINASDIFVKMRKSLGNKRHEISPGQIDEITQIYRSFAEGKYCKIFNNEDFGYRKVTIERPLRLNYQVSPERIARLQEQTAFINLAKSKKKDPVQRAEEEAQGRKLQEQIRQVLSRMDNQLSKNHLEFAGILEGTFKKARVRLNAQLKKAVLAALSEKDETAEIVYDEDGNPVPDPELRDAENIPLKEDIWEYFEREVKPHVPDAWINRQIRDEKDGRTGKVGYEISFTRYFYQYQPPRPLAEIEADIRRVETEILEMLREVVR
ncbi:MAG: SAM-dependent DNA methyltransferase [Peptococcaceae bacterium]|nr:MAG: SAM-dependent DNA methyltransferase [Peptococcaceae bacterium]